MGALSVSKAWDDSRPIIARDGKLMFTIALATVVLPQAIITLFAPESMAMMPADEEGSLEGTSQMFGLTFIASLINLIGSIAISYLALTRGASVGDGLMRGVRRLLPTIGAFFLLIGLFVALVFLIALVAAGGVSIQDLADPDTAAALSPLAAILLLAVFVFFIFAAVRFLLMTPVIAAEDIGPVKILRRSWSLTKGHFWRLFAFLVLFAIGAIIFTTAVGIIFGLAFSLFLGDPEPMTLAALFIGLVNGLAAAALTVVYSTILARFYLQLAGLPSDPVREEFNPTSVPPTAG